MSVLGHGTEICTSTTRPSTAAKGTVVFETDTDKILVNSSGTSTPVWVEISDITNGASNVIQRNVVSVVKSDAFTESLNANATSSTDHLSASITPTSSTSKILVYGFMFGSNAGPNPLWISLFRNGSKITGAVGNSAGSRDLITASGTAYDMGGSLPFFYLDSPATTSSITYSVRVTNSSNITRIHYINRSLTDTDGVSFPRAVSTLTAIEVPV